MRTHVRFRASLSLIGTILVTLLVYVALFFVGSLLLIENSVRIGLPLGGFEAMSAVAATLGNIGPRFGIVCPMANYAPFADSSKLLLIALMWIGRLEILPVLAIFTSSFWRR